MGVWVTSPHLAVVARFLGGVYVSVHPMSVWDGEGRIVPSGRPPARVPVIALCPEDARAHGLKEGRPNLRMLYSSFPVPLSRAPALFLDPASLPFVGVRLLNALSGLDPKNYPYYQRRLAEFQSRLESTLQVGRELLASLEGLDLTGASSGWIRAALEHSIRPPEALWVSWGKGAEEAALAASLVEARRRGWIVLVDYATPAPIRARALAAGALAIAPPRIDQEPFLYYYDQYLVIWNAHRRGIVPSPRP
jgi:hypothetical protein